MPTEPVVVDQAKGETKPRWDQHWHTVPGRKASPLLRIRFVLALVGTPSFQSLLSVLLPAAPVTPTAIPPRRSLNVCYLYEVFEEKNCVDLVMELCSGGELWDK